MKTVKFTINIGENDFKRKINQSIKFLEKRNQVKVMVTLFGRERSRPEVGLEMIQRVHEELKEHGNIAGKSPTTNNLSIVYNPK